MTVTHDDTVCRVENILRFLAFALCKRYGIDNATKQIKAVKANQRLVNKIGELAMYKICKGILAEIAFYNLWARDVSALPTLDAGCHCDFVGVVGKRLGCIDVTSNFLCKSNIPLEYGSLKWPYWVAEVKDMSLRWFRPDPNGGLKPADINVRKSIANEHKICVSRNLAEDVKIFRRRHAMFNHIVKREPYAEELLNASQMDLHEAIVNHLLIQARFYQTYSYALNLVPMLAAYDTVHFVGQHGNRCECYHMHSDAIPVTAESIPSMDDVQHQVVTFENGSFNFTDADSFFVFPRMNKK